MIRTWTVAVLATCIVLGGCEKEEKAPPKKPAPATVKQPTPPPSEPVPPAEPVEPPPVTTQAEPVPDTQPVVVTPPPTEPVVSTPPDIPNPLPDAKVGQWVVYKKLTGDGGQVRLGVIGVRSDTKEVHLERKLLDASGQSIGQPTLSWLPMAGRTRPEPAEVTREKIVTPAGTFECVLVTVKGTDVDNRPYVNKTWFCADVPIEGIVRTEVRSEGKLQQGEVLTRFQVK